MKASINEEKEHKTTTAKKSHFTYKGLLNSGYKRMVKRNFRKAGKKSIFGIKQRAKLPKMCQTTHATSMLLKVSVFAGVALVACV